MAVVGGLIPQKPTTSAPSARVHAHVRACANGGKPLQSARSAAERGRESAVRDAHEDGGLSISDYGVGADDDDDHSVRGRVRGVSSAGVDSRKRPHRGLGIVGRLRRRAARSGDSADSSSSSPAVDGVLDGVAREVEVAIAARRRRLNARLGASLREFRTEVLEEVEVQSEAAKERRARLASRQQALSRSLDALRRELEAEIEETLEGVAAGGRSLERALRSMRATWEGEVAELIREAEAEIDDAVGEIEDSIALKADEWRRRVLGWERQWADQGQWAEAGGSGGSSLGLG